MRVFLGFFLYASFLFGQNAPIDVIPTPRDVTYFDAAFSVRQTTRIAAPPEENPTARLLREYLSQSTGSTAETIASGQVGRWTDVIYLDIFNRSPKAEAFSHQLDIATIMELGEEGYFLQSTDSTVVILANTSHGLFNGAMTLIQVLRQQGGSRVPGLTVIDRPILTMRGMSLDLRHGSVPNLDRFKEIIKTLGRYKLNTCILDIGPLFRYNAFPEIGRTRGMLSAEEIRELQVVAQHYHVQLIPSVATLTGFAPVLALPEYQRLAAFPGSGSLDIRNEEAYDFLHTAIGEISQVFASPLIEIDDGHGADLIRGAADRSEILSRHQRRIFEMLRKNSKQAIVKATSPADIATPDSVLFLTPARGPQIKNGLLIDVPAGSGSEVLPDFLAIAGEMERSVLAGLDNGATGIVADFETDAAAPCFSEFSQPALPTVSELSWRGESIAMAELDRLIIRELPDLEDALTLLSLLDALTRPAFWSDLWRHPLVMASEQEVSAYRKRANHLWNDMTRALRILNLAATDDARNHGRPGYYRYAAEHGLWLAKKLDAVVRLAELRAEMDGNPVLDGAAGLMQLCHDISDELSRLMEEFQILWLRSNRTEDVGRFLDLYGTQISYWRETARLIELGRLREVPWLENAWMRHPDENGEPATHAFFRKTFDLRPGFRTAYLQVIPNGHAKIYLNSAFLDEAIFRESGPARMWQLSSSGLVPGKNVIAIEAWNYRGEPAGVHVYGEVEYEFGHQEIIESDRYWRTSVKAGQDWQRLGYFDVQWLNSVAYKNDITIIKPNAETQRAGHLEY